MSTFDWNDLFADKLVGKKEDKQVSVPVSDLSGKHVGVYFSAHW